MTIVYLCDLRDPQDPQDHGILWSRDFWITSFVILVVTCINNTVIQGSRTYAYRDLWITILSEDRDPLDLQEHGLVYTTLDYVFQ